MNKKYILYVIIPAITVAAAGIITVSTVSADSTVKMGNHMANLVTAIAQKFNLNPSDVQQVFDQQKTQLQAQMKDKMAQAQAQMQQRFTDNLNRSVTDGKLTQAQVDLIIAKKAELDAQKPVVNIAQKGGSQITPKTKAEMQTQQDALTKWASDNNIPTEYLKLLQFRGGRGGQGFRGFTGNKPTQPAN